MADPQQRFPGGLFLSTVFCVRSEGKATPEVDDGLELLATRRERGQVGPPQRGHDVGCRNGKRAAKKLLAIGEAQQNIAPHGSNPHADLARPGALRTEQ